MKLNGIRRRKIVQEIKSVAPYNEVNCTKEIYEPNSTLSSQSFFVFVGGPTEGGFFNPGDKTEIGICKYIKILTLYQLL